MKRLILWITMPLMAGNTPAFFKKIEIRNEKRRAYISHLRTRSDSVIIRKQPKRNMKKKLAAKQLHWL